MPQTCYPNAMNLILLDPSLKDYRGHFYNYDTCIARSWTNNIGGTCSALSRKNNVIVSSDFKNVPTYNFQLEQLVKGSDFLSRKNLNSLAQKFANETLEGLQKSESNSSISLVFLHTTTPAQILGLKFIAEKLPRNSRFKFVIMLRYSPKINPITPSLEMIFAYKWVFNQIRKIEIQLSFVSDSTLLKEEYEELFEIEVQMLPIPHTFTFNENSVNQKPLTVGMLGPARSTKGLHYYPRLALSLKPLSDVKIMVQSNILFSHDRDALVAKEILQSSENVNLIDKELSPIDYEDALKKLDIVALPYQISYYHSQTSGIMAEAASLGKPCVVPKGTWMSLQMQSGRVAGASFEPGHLEDFIQQVQTVIKDFSNYKGIALDRMSDWNNFHNSDNFVNKLHRLGQQI